jgi:VanZ family protein
VYSPPDPTGSPLGRLESLPEARRLAWQRRPSALIRWAFLAYFLLVVDASLYPFTGWVDIGVGAFDYLEAPWPRRALEFDVVINILGYLPLGFLGVVALYPRVRNFGAAVLVAGFAFLTSLSMEALQTFLPMRVASNVDLVTNVLGAFSGIALGLAVVEGLLDRGRLRQLRFIWFERRAHRTLLLAVLWFGAIVYPERYAIGAGSIIDELATRWPEIAQWNTALIERWPAAPGWFEGVDALVTGGYLLAALLLFLDSARTAAPRLWLLFAFVAVTLGVKTLGTGLTYASDDPFVWISPGSIAGFSLAAMVATLLLAASPRVRRWITVLALGEALLFANFGPDNMLLEVASRSWQRGRLLNFYGLALGVSMVWPVLALGLTLFRKSERGFSPAR